MAKLATLTLEEKAVLVEAKEIRHLRDCTPRENKRALQAISDVRDALLTRSGFVWKNLCWKTPQGKTMTNAQYEFLQKQISEEK